ncbi:site-specific integrase [Rhizobium sp. P32RR-XVIII]|uniref:site-specific integrase n=1 Tax=Rhizobium sp. P32RR-XVIII TaxID=2726738 RepID=UPI0014567C9D|nr:site-specific integrase [Rhizobium sp. P32RR-XVIII]NLS04620.1 site-specific integrase [Rhizobium sp. P32RR-XVIII]
MTKVLGLTQRGGTYSVRRRVPTDLVEALGKKEIWLALGTSDRKTAEREARLVAVQLDLQWQKQRETLRKGEKITVADEVTEADLRRLVVGRFWRQEQSATALPADEEIRENIEHDIGGFESRDPSAEAALFAEARSLIKAEKLNIPAPADTVVGKSVEPFTASDALRQLVELLRRANIEHLERSLDRMDGKHGDGFHDPLFKDVSSISQAPAVSRSVTLGEAIQRFETDPMRAHLGDTADAKYVITFRTMKEVLGPDKPLASITRAECAIVQELFSGLPANVHKKSAYNDCTTVREIVALAAERKTDKLLAAGTVKVYTQTQSAFFNWAINKGLIASNPASGMAPKKAKKGKRRAYDIEQMNKLLAALPEWSEQGALAGRYWVYIIAIFSGMRLGEIGTLNIEDIVERYGAHFFQLWETDERGLKTEGSERIIPVHPELIRLGLLQRVARLKKAGIRRLFADLPGDDQDHVSDLFSKRFAYFLKSKLEMKDKGLTFHSTRHTFRDALREAGVPHDATTALGGWKPKGVDERYGDGMRPQTLVKWMNEVKYEGLVIPVIEEAAS